METHINLVCLNYFNFILLLRIIIILHMSLHNINNVLSILRKSQNRKPHDNDVYLQEDGGRVLRGKEKGEKCEVDNRYSAAPLHTSPRRHVHYKFVRRALFRTRTNHFSEDPTGPREPRRYSPGIAFSVVR